MKNRFSNPVFKRTARNQSDGNRRIATALALFALCVFVTAIVRQWLASH